MVLSSPESDPGYFGFTDLHGYKDFVTYVLSCAPDLFPAEDWRKPEEQMNLHRAFVGLRYGLDLVEQEMGDSAVLTNCRELVEEADAAYGAARYEEGLVKLEKVEKLLRKLPTQ